MIPPSPLLTPSHIRMKPPSPMLAPEQRPLKPATPLQPKNARKTPISHPQRRWRFHLRLGLREQRRRRFQLPPHRPAKATPVSTAPSPARKGDAGFTPDFRCRLEVAGPGRTTSQRTSHTSATRRRRCGERRRDRRDPRAWLRCPWAVAGPGRASRRRAERSSRRGRRAGGPPPTGTPSSPAHRT